MLYLQHNYVQLGDGDVAIHPGYEPDPSSPDKQYAIVAFMNKKKGPITTFPEPSKMPKDMPLASITANENNSFVLSFKNKESIDALMSVLSYVRYKSFGEE